ncbi:hypothetical protein Dsin_024662 [Dipteronia sinensis]|uniref:Reverse transcriptase domain-containing protein n=1 Tax=Dipteronia sinensis TaxID=43782 RepID=A0AAE0DW82_9ROSI|nr:hypothetical protein Dsin_024662 [Dipteronia sinensis]
MRFIKEFHKDGAIVKDLNHTFLALISKTLNLVSMGDFKPISLIGAMYKILTKVLANRIKKVMHFIIGEFQMAFVKGRQIINSFLIAEEIINKWRNDHMGGLIVKLDFEKAYNSVDHGFLDYMMECLSFFIIKALDFGLVQGEDFGGDRINISHLQFADDTLLFLKPKIESLINVKRILRSKACGGLGIGVMETKNMGLLAKWIWRFGNEEAPLCEKGLERIEMDLECSSEKQPIWLKWCLYCKLVCYVMEDSSSKRLLSRQFQLAGVVSSESGSLCMAAAKSKSISDWAGGWAALSPSNQHNKAWNSLFFVVVWFV